MKKINKLILMGILLFTFTTTVNASNITWENITTEWKNLLSESGGYSITSDDKLLTITLNDETGSYETKFAFENDVISLIITDNSELTGFELVQFDDIMVDYMIEMICMLLDINKSSITSKTSEELTQMGIIYETKEITYSEETENSSVTITKDNIEKFSIDLNKFEEATIELKGTYNKGDNITIDKPTVNLSLEKAEANNLILAANIDGISEDDTAYCNIYLIPAENTGYPSGTSKVVATINNCQKGKNLVTISNLSPNTKYTFQVVSNITTSSGLTDIAVGESYITFQTATESVNNTQETTDNTQETTDNTQETIDNTQETITNPKTGSSFIFAVIACLIISIISFTFMYKTVNKSRL